MMIATLIVPQSDKQGLHSTYRARLATEFGGWTAHEAIGGWISPTGVEITEPVVVYTVAMDDSPANRSAMRALARTVKADMEQEAVYLSFTQADVEFI